MSRLTITLSEPRYRALKEAAAQRDKTIGQLIDESLDLYGIKSREQAKDLAQHAIVLTTDSSVSKPVAPDPGDQFLWDLLASRSDLVLVTGDKLLLQNQPMQPRVLSPQAFVAQWLH